MNDEIKEDIQKDHWNNNHLSILIKYGLVCEDGIFYRYRREYDYDEGCVAEYKNKRFVIGEYAKKNTLTIASFDEFGIPDSFVTLNTKRTCSDLYKQFKQDMK